MHHKDGKEAGKYDTKEEQNQTSVMTLRKWKLRPCEVTQKVKALAAQPDNMSEAPNRVGVGEN